MKKYSLLKMVSLAFLSSFVLTMYSTKFESIILGVDFPSYFIFMAMSAICGLLLYTKEEIKDWFELTLKKDKKINVNNVPDLVYNFCKTYYFKEDSEVTNFVKTEIKDKNLANFFVRYLDKNTKEEIDEYLGAQEVLKKQKESNARKVMSCNNLLITIGVIASYIYDSNIKGILLLAGGFSIYNMIISRNIEKNIAMIDKMTELYKHINEDILTFKNPRQIMYKCKSILMLEDAYVTIDNLEVLETTTPTVVGEYKEVVKEKPQLKGINIEERKSALVTIGKNKNKAKDKESKVVKL